MPELPEVETVKLQLQKYLVGHSIEQIEIKNRRLFPKDEEKIIGAKVKEIRRFGKVLVIDTSNGYSLVIHIKMTGQLIYRGPNLQNPIELSKKVAGGLGGKHTHVIFHLNNGGILYFNDIRRFGWIKVVEGTKLHEQNDFIAKLGPEPLKDLSFEVFEKIINSTKRPIKIVLMDQTKIGGIGNIYANDALWLSMINPRTIANTLTQKKQKDLYKAIIKVLEKGIKYGGASELSFVTPEGIEGSYQMHTLVYGREGKDCDRCGTEISKFTLGGRGTYICPQCQK